MGSSSKRLSYQNFLSGGFDLDDLRYGEKALGVNIEF